MLRRNDVITETFHNRTYYVVRIIVLFWIHVPIKTSRLYAYIHPCTYMYIAWHIIVYIYVYIYGIQYQMSIYCRIFSIRIKSRPYLNITATVCCEACQCVQEKTTQLVRILFIVPDDDDDW